MILDTNALSAFVDGEADVGQVLRRQARAAIPVMLRNPQDELAEKVTSGHDLVRLGSFGEIERASHHASQASIRRHVHHGGEAAATPRATAHQGQIAFMCQRSAPTVRGAVRTCVITSGVAIPCIERKCARSSPESCS